MPNAADLELALRRQSADTYSVELRFTQPGDEADVRLARREPFLARFDHAALRALALDPVAYGRMLGQQMFADARLHEEFAKARTSARTLDVPLRVRLYIDPGALELHELAWETLRDPADDTFLATSERVLFSRYLASGDWRRVPRRAQSELRAIVFIANPSDLSQYSLAPIPVAEELERATQALGNVPVTPLASDGRATLSQLTQALREGYDILYILCHGAIKDNAPYLWLENENRQTDMVPGRALIERIGELEQPPRLVVLASCQSARVKGEDRAFVALGPLLAESGVAAVVAMRDNISMQTVDKLMPTFFSELRKDGEIDRALAVARGMVREQPDAWMPVLFMRLKSGALWYRPDFAGEQRMEQWPPLVEYIHQNLDLPEQVSCIPILGSGLLDALFGSSHEIARCWADQSGFPLAAHAREDLPQVAQYLAIMHGRNYPRTQLAAYLRSELVQRFGERVAGDMRTAPLDQVMASIGKHLREQDAAEPNKVLAQLPFPVYITTNPDNLLADALVDAGKQPQVEICPWDEQTAAQTSVFDNRDYRPDIQHPLVYHLFGHLKQPRSLILTEDEYFDYLIGMTSNKTRIPTIVRAALADSLLLFLGFQIDDWNFRVLLRSIMTRGGSARLSDYAHVAVQIDPEESRIADPQRARRYLERYFQNDHINVYWGSVYDFVRQLLPLWIERRKRDPWAPTGASTPSLSMVDVQRLLK